jgi:uncharacterized membrane-anchored protein YitT (DUF2179 family)
MLKRVLKEYSIITFGATLAGVAIYFFMLPLNIAIGSGSAIALILSYYIPLPVSTISLVFNVLMLLLGFLLVGREFGAKTVYASLIVPVSLGVFEQIFPNFQSLTQDPLLDTLCYILVVGIAMAILFSHNASSGGLDIVAKIMSKYLRMGLGNAVSISGIAVALSSVFIPDIETKTVVISVLGTYFSGIIVDKFIFGLNVKRRVCIISEKLDEIVDFILHSLHSGATLYDSTGAYNNVMRREAVVIVDKNEYRLLMDFVKKTDPRAFVTVIEVNELRYQPKERKK